MTKRVGHQIKHMISRRVVNGAILELYVEGPFIGATLGGIELGKVRGKKPLLINPSLDYEECLVFHSYVVALEGDEVYSITDWFVNGVIPTFVEVVYHDYTITE